MRMMRIVLFFLLGLFDFNIPFNIAGNTQCVIDSSKFLEIPKKQICINGFITCFNG